MNNESRKPSQRGMSRREFLSLAGLTLLAACTPAPLLAQRPTPRNPVKRVQPAVFPDGDAWQTSTAGEQGIDQARIDAMLKKIQAEKLPTDSFLLVRNGYLVAEHYFNEYDREKLHIQRSCTKSVNSTLIGIAIDEGAIQGVDQKVLDFFQERKTQNLDPAYEALKIKDLLTMAIGQSSGFSPSPDQIGIDWIDRFFSQKFSCQPGGCFLYNSAGPYILTAILQRATGRPAVEYLREKLFGPMGITNFNWPADEAGIYYGHSHLELRPVDMLKFGYLFLNEGNWSGRQLVSRGWVDQATIKHADTLGKMNTAEDFGYGYNWWMNGFGGYSAHGASGQYIFVLPEMDLTEVFTGGYDDAGFPTNYELMRTFIIPAIA
jgi:CubicO group peptidase (beta-lactamase class C family)